MVASFCFTLSHPKTGAIKKDKWWCALVDAQLASEDLFFGPLLVQNPQQNVLLKLSHEFRQALLNLLKRLT